MLVPAVLGELGVAYLQSGQLDYAIACLTWARRLAEVLGNPNALRTITFDLAKAYRQKGDLRHNRRCRRWIADRAQMI